jgi:hypothetical protein
MLFWILGLAAVTLINLAFIYRRLAKFNTMAVDINLDRSRITRIQELLGGISEDPRGFHVINDIQRRLAALRRRRLALNDTIEDLERLDTRVSALGEVLHAHGQRLEKLEHDEILNQTLDAHNERLTALEELTEQAQEDGLYEGTPLAEIRAAQRECGHYNPDLSGPIVDHTVHERIQTGTADFTICSGPISGVRFIRFGDVRLDS